MAYNKAKEEKRWKQWKDNEEKQLRSLGMDEDIIKELRGMDWDTYNAERRYREHQILSTDYLEQQGVEMEEPEAIDIRQLLDSIYNEQLLHILLETDRKTLQVISLKMLGFTIGEISRQTGMSEKAIYCRMDRLKKKIKKIL